MIRPHLAHRGSDGRFQVEQRAVTLGGLTRKTRITVAVLLRGALRKLRLDGCVATNYTRSPARVRCAVAQGARRCGGSPASTSGSRAAYSERPRRFFLGRLAVGDLARRSRVLPADAARRLALLRGKPVSSITSTASASAASPARSREQCRARRRHPTARPHACLHLPKRRNPELERLLDRRARHSRSPESWKLMD